MSSLEKAKNIQELAVAPVVSADSSSVESQLARQAKQLELQSATDSAYDTVIERFESPSRLLLGLTIASALLLASLVLQKGR